MTGRFFAPERITELLGGDSADTACRPFVSAILHVENPSGRHPTDSGYFNLRAAAGIWDWRAKSDCARQPHSPRGESGGSIARLASRKSNALEASRHPLAWQVRPAVPARQDAAVKRLILCSSGFISFVTLPGRNAARCKNGFRPRLRQRHISRPARNAAPKQPLALGQLAIAPALSVPTDGIACVLCRRRASRPHAVPPAGRARWRRFGALGGGGR